MWISRHVHGHAGALTGASTIRIRILGRRPMSYASGLEIPHSSGNLVKMVSFDDLLYIFQQFDKYE